MTANTKVELGKVLEETQFSNTQYSNPTLKSQQKTIPIILYKNMVYIYIKKNIT